MADLNKIIEQLSNLTIIEASELANALEKKWNIKPLQVSGVQAASSEKPTEVQEQSEFTVNMKSIGANKIKVIKAVKEILGIGLKESKELVDTTPTKIKEKLSKEEAQKIKITLENAGAEVELV
jgi:large subunit ribosomal protein L7/L12